MDLSYNTVESNFLLYIKLYKKSTTVTISSSLLMCLKCSKICRKLETSLIHTSATHVKMNHEYYFFLPLRELQDRRSAVSKILLVFTCRRRSFTKVDYLITSIFFSCDN
jgi:hypothetical protein